MAGVRWLRDVSGEWRPVSAIPSAVERPAVERHPPPRRRLGARWLVWAAYLAGAVAVTWRLWADPAGRMQAGDVQDVNLFAWFLRYSATAIAHGHLPALVTTALNAPRGVNLMWNTSFLLPGMLLTPVTLLAGPQVSLTIVLTLGIAGSAASLFWVLRRWGASVTGAALGGAVYGFSPAMLNSGTGHYQLVFAVLPPLIVDAVARIVTGRGRTVGNGVRLGLLTAAQLFIGEELLVYTAVAGVALVAALALGHPRAVRGRVRDTTLGLLTGAAVVLLIGGYPLWVQFRGPLREHSSLYGSWSNNPAYFVDPSGHLLFHSTSSAAFAARYPLGLPEVLAYLGWPLIIVLVVAGICFWRDPRVRAAAVTCAVLELCSLGGGPQLIGGFRLSGSLLPYHWLQGLPALAQVIPGRFCVLGAAAAGGVLAFSLDHARSAVRGGQGWRRGVPVAVAVLAVLPLLPLPYQATPVPPVPAGWQTAFARLRLAPDARVLIVPVTLIIHTEVMRWQADTGEPGSMIGGYFVGPGPTGQAVFSIGPPELAARYLDWLWSVSGSVSSSSPRLVRSALAYWRPAAVIAVTGAGSPLGRFLTGLLGRPSFGVGQLLAWRR
jgi:hypothetical protein